MGWDHQRYCHACWRYPVCCPTELSSDHHSLLSHCSSCSFSSGLCTHTHIGSRLPTASDEQRWSEMPWFDKFQSAPSSCSIHGPEALVSKRRNTSFCMCENGCLRGSNAGWLASGPPAVAQSVVVGLLGLIFWAAEREAEIGLRMSPATKSKKQPQQKEQDPINTQA